MRVERAGRLLCFYVGVPRVYPSEDASFRGADAPEHVLARRSVLAVVAVWTEWTYTEPEKVLVCKHGEDAKAVHRCQGVFDECSC